MAPSAPELKQVLSTSRGGAHVLPIRQRGPHLLPIRQRLRWRFALISPTEIAVGVCALQLKGGCYAVCFLAMYSLWWKAALAQKELVKEPNVIVLMPEDDAAPKLSMTAPTVTSYQG